MCRSLTYNDENLSNRNKDIMQVIHSGPHRMIFIRVTTYGQRVATIHT
jgi:hypothetical protein